MTAKLESEIFLCDRTDAIIILTIVLASGLLSFWQERGASNAVEKLLALGQNSDRVLFYVYLNAASESGYANPFA